MAKNNLHTEFMELYQLHHVALSNYCRILVSDQEDAKDLMSEVVLSALKNFKNILKPQNFKFYLFGIASNLLKRKIYNKNLTIYYNNQFAKTNTYADDEALKLTELYMFKKMLIKIQEPLREVFVLFEINDLSLKEISELIGIPLSTVKTRLTRAREALAELYKDEKIIYN